MLTGDPRRLLRRRRLPTARRESADKETKKATESWETTKEVAAEGAEKAAATLEYTKEKGGKHAKRVWGKSKEGAEWHAHGRPRRRSPRRALRKPKMVDRL